MNDELTYAEVGGTRDAAMPSGYRHLTHRARVGYGRATFDAATDAVMTFRMIREGAHVTTSADRAAPGVRIVSRFGIGGLRIAAPCRVVWTVAEDSRRGFGYGTLAGHPVCGEEAFIVERDADDQVWFTLRSFSRPKSWYTRLAGPLLPVGQYLFAVWCTATLRRLVRH